MRSMLIVIRNLKAIEEEVVAVDEVYLAVSAMENRLTTMTAKHSVPYSAASHTAIRQWLTSRFERSMESGSRTVARHAICITYACYRKFFMYCISRQILCLSRNLH